MHLCVYSNIHMLLYVQCICTMDVHTWEAVNVHFAGFYTVICVERIICLRASGS